MKKLSLLAILGSSIALTGCGDNYPTLAQIKGDEYKELFSQIRDKAENGLSDNFWKEWEDRLEYAEEIKQALENGNMIKNNKFTSETSHYVFEVLGEIREECSSLRSSRDSEVIRASKLCNSTPIDQVIELFSK